MSKPKCNLHPTGAYTGSFERCPWCCIPKGQAPPVETPKATAGPSKRQDADPLSIGSIVSYVGSTRNIVREKRLRGVDLVVVSGRYTHNGTLYVWVSTPSVGTRLAPRVLLVDCQDLVSKNGEAQV